MGLFLIDRDKGEKPFPAFCRDCGHCKTAENNGWDMRCHHPVVNAQDNWALANGKSNGTSCSEERSKGIVRSWNTCGQRGALWDPRKGEKSGLFT